MNKLIAILLLSTVTCFGGSKFVSGKFVKGAMPFLPPSSNGLLNQISNYWSFNSYNGSPNYGSLSLYDTSGGSVGFIGSGLLNAGIDCPVGNDTSIGLQGFGDIPDYSSDFTISIWAAPYQSSAQITAGSVFYIYGDTYGESFDIAFAAYEMTYGADFFGAGIAQNGVSLTWNANDWIHIVATWSSSSQTMSIYVNGNLGTMDNLGHNFQSETLGNVYILGDFGSNIGYGSFYGRVDEVGTWNRVLTQSQITQLYNNGAGYPFSSFAN
tara:strand:+ start:1010 stop:1813 length:804 start_codon:yes stop_codon:yes gene_type:complete